VVAEVLYTLTDPVLRALRRVLPPLRIGGIALDLSYLAAYLGIAVLRNLLGSLL
jgi:YggT family protein